MFIFTIYDSISQKAGRLLVTETIAEAERQFNDVLANAEQGSLFNTHPADRDWET